MTSKTFLYAGTMLGLMAWFVMGCNGGVPKDSYLVQGHIAGHANAKVYLDQVLPESNQVVDSAETDGDGNFQLHSNGPIEGVYSVRMPSRQSLMVYLNHVPASIEADAGQFSLGKAAGNKETTSLVAFNKERGGYRNNFVRHMRDLKLISQEMTPEPWAAKEMLADKASEQYRTYVIGYADTVSSKLLADYATFNLNVEGDFYHIQQYLAAQNAAGRHSVFTDYLDAQILLVGDPFLRYEAEDFKMATYTGDSVSLSSLRGKVVYLYIWSSYCGMSRMENERLATWYDAHPDSKVAILSYSIDVDERLWRKAIQEDSLHWPHQVMGMFEWTSPEIQQFGVRNIPVSFLLDAKGIIRSKAIHASELDRDYDKIVAQWGAK